MAAKQKCDLSEGLPSRERKAGRTESACSFAKAGSKDSLSDPWRARASSWRWACILARLADVCGSGVCGAARFVRVAVRAASAPSVCGWPEHEYEHAER